MANIIIAIGILFFLGHALSWFFEKTKIPDLLILVGLGYLVGPLWGAVKPQDFGKVGDVLATVTLIVILYEGGIHLKAKDLLTSSLPAAGLSLLGFLAIVAVGTLLTFSIALQPWSLALLLGLAIGSTSSAIVIPMVKPLSIREDTKTVLSLESAFTDVLTIVIFLVIMNSIVSGAFSMKKLLVGIGPETLLSILIGITSAWIWAFIKKRFSKALPKAFAGEAWALLTYGILQASGKNGAIGVLALGFALSNIHLFIPETLDNFFNRDPLSPSETTLLSEVTFLLRTFFFIYLGTLVKFSNIPTVLFALLLTFMVFVTRYFVVQIIFKKQHTPRLDAMVATAMGPRGLACAVLATLPLKKGLEGGQWLQDVIFALIPMTIFFTALFVALSEKPFFRKKMTKLFGKYPEVLPLQADNASTSSSSQESETTKPARA